MTFELGPRTAALRTDPRQREARSRPGGDEHATSAQSATGTLTLEAIAADRPLAGGGLADQSFPVVAQRLGAQLGDRQRDDSLEADRAGG